ncbi:MAG: D-alanyl-D-alanine dipeptidase [Scytolyngbya sp. HA4215-MV1]|jgi:D-alanyl-D-alanine dipeptidase|nr:D-alanyl-D-alanine dipeptidase [Scytolyngbya sp. HA4215-MV1]
MKPYQQVPIVESGEPLIQIPENYFLLESPHPYEKLGAPYDTVSPYYLREGVLAALIAAQAKLQDAHPDWRIYVFDAYRPVAVQQFMVDYTFAEQLKTRGISASHLTEIQKQQVWDKVYEFWAVPNADPAMPPPHSTGAAIDLTLVDATGEMVKMGSAIDELTSRSYPDYFAQSQQPLEQRFHYNRQALRQAMQAAGFQQHPNEWWHFCLGDQMWAWLTNQQQPDRPVMARYGRV